MSYKNKNLYTLNFQNGCIIRLLLILTFERADRSYEEVAPIKGIKDCLVKFPFLSPKKPTIGGAMKIYDFY